MSPIFANLKKSASEVMFAINIFLNDLLKMLDENIKVEVEIFANTALICKICKNLDLIHKTHCTVCHQEIDIL